MIYSEHYKHAKSNHIILLNNKMHMFVDLDTPVKYNNPDIHLVWFMKEDKIAKYSWKVLIDHNFQEYEFDNIKTDVRW